MDAWEARHDLDAAAFRTAFNQLAAAGYRLIGISGYLAGAAPRYGGIWVNKSGPAWQARHGMTTANYQTTFNALAAQGYRPLRVSAFATPAGTLFGAIWDKSAVAQWQAQHGITASACQIKFNQMAQAGFRLIDVCGYEEGGQDLYAAIWERSPGPAWQAFHGLDAAQYQVQFEQLAAQGQVLLRVSGYSVAGTSRYAAIWQQRASGGWQGRRGMDSAAYQRAFDDALYQGYRLLQVCGYATPAGAQFAAVWESQHYDAARLAAAVTRMTTGCAANPLVALGWGVDGIGQAALVDTRQPNTAAGAVRPVWLRRHEGPPAPGLEAASIGALRHATATSASPCGSQRGHARKCQWMRAADRGRARTAR